MELVFKASELARATLESKLLVLACFGNLKIQYELEMSCSAAQWQLQFPGNLQLYSCNTRVTQLIAATSSRILDPKKSTYNIVDEGLDNVFPQPDNQNLHAIAAKLQW